MSVVALTVHKRQFQLSCPDGQEAELHQLAAQVSERTQQLAQALGSGNDMLLFATAAIMLQSELNEAKAKLKTLSKQEPAKPISVPMADPVETQAAVTDAVTAIADYVEAMIARMNKQDV